MQLPQPTHARHHAFSLQTQRRNPGSQSQHRSVNRTAVLWSLFEAKALNEHGSADAIVESAKQWARSGQLTPDMFRQELAYFRDRYVVDGAFNYHFEHLHLRQNDAPSLVQKVLKGEDVEPEEVAAAILIFVYGPGAEVPEQPLSRREVVLRITGTA